jgi:hypothetical protein
MARRPLPEMAALSVRIARGWEGFWAIMLRLDTLGPFTVSAIDAEGNSDRADVAQYVRRLVKAGFLHIIRTGTAARPEKLYRLARRPSTAPRVRRDGSLVGPSLQQRVWTAVRSQRGGFTEADIAFAAGDDKPLPRPAVSLYIRRLLRAGYLAPQGEGFRLKPGMSTGPRAPSVHRLTLLWDPNIKRVVVGDHVAEEAA